MHLNRRSWVVGWVAGVVNQLVQLVQSHPAGVETENEKHGLDQIWFSWAIGTYHAGEIAMKSTYLLRAGIWLEVLQDHVVNHKSWPFFPHYIEIDGPSDRCLDLTAVLLLLGFMLFWDKFSEGVVGFLGIFLFWLHVLHKWIYKVIMSAKRVTNTINTNDLLISLFPSLPCSSSYSTYLIPLCTASIPSQLPLILSSSHLWGLQPWDSWWWVSFHVLWSSYFFIAALQSCSSFYWVDWPSFFYC